MGPIKKWNITSRSCGSILPVNFEAPVTIALTKRAKQSRERMHYEHKGGKFFTAEINGTIPHTKATLNKHCPDAYI